MCWFTITLNLTVCTPHVSSRKSSRPVSSWTPAAAGREIDTSVNKCTVLINWNKKKAQILEPPERSSIHHLVFTRERSCTPCYSIIDWGGKRVCYGLQNSCLFPAKARSHAAPFPRANRGLRCQQSTWRKAHDGSTMGQKQVQEDLQQHQILISSWFAERNDKKKKKKYWAAVQATLSMKLLQILAFLANNEVFFTVSSKTPQFWTIVLVHFLICWDSLHIRKPSYSTSFRSWPQPKLSKSLLRLIIQNIFIQIWCTYEILRHYSVFTTSRLQYEYTI
jgi:hypothetical protein